MAELAIHEVDCSCSLCSQEPTAREDATEVTGSGQPGASTLPVLDDAATIAQLTTNFSSAGYDISWDGNTVSYAISNIGAGDGSGETGGFVAMSAAMQEAARDAFEMWDDLIAIDLVETTSASSNISFNYSSQTSGGGTYASFGGYYGAQRTDARFGDVDIWLNTSWWTHDQDSDLYDGGYGIKTYIHEIGHALGLSHPGRYNGTGNFATDAEYFQDTRQYSVMSYFDADENGSGTDHRAADGYWQYASTPLLHDILAMQAHYGADMTTRTEDTVYGFNTTANREAFDFSLNDAPIVAIWDAGGTDTLDLSGFADDQEIDLREGHFSSVGGLTNNVAIAEGAIIEIAIGGIGSDALIGNGVANRLDGGLGDDTLTGGAGADVFAFSFGQDTVTDFEAGSDSIDISAFSLADYSVLALDGHALLSNGAHQMAILNASVEEVRDAAGIAADTATIELAKALSEYGFAFAADGLSLSVTDLGDPSGGVMVTAETEELIFAGGVSASISALADGILTDFAFADEAKTIKTLSRDSDGQVTEDDFVDGVLSSSVLTETDGDVRTALYRADGARESFTFEDVSDTRSWTSYTNIYDESGLRSDHDRVFDNGNAVHRGYVGGVMASKANVAADGDVRTTLYGSDGERDSFTYEDVSDTRSWTSYTNFYDENGLLSESERVDDNGNVLQRGYVGGVMAIKILTEADGDVRTTHYGADGQRDSFTFEDISDARSWSSYTNTYDDNGDFLQREYFYDIA